MLLSRYATTIVPILARKIKYSDSSNPRRRFLTKNVIDIYQLLYSPLPTHPRSPDSSIVLPCAASVIIDKKTIKEEEMLVEVHGAAYEHYRNSVAKFVPRYY